MKKYLVLGGSGLRLKILHDGLALKIPNLDALLSGGTKPVTVGAEAKGVNDGPSIKRIKTLPLS